ncbi:MAG: hypothetical protein VCC68_09835 [Myxococcota bacterium]
MAMIPRGWPWRVRGNLIVDVRPPDKLRRFIYAELDTVEREATGKHEAVTKLQVLAERIVDDAIAPDASRVARSW